jgi:ABC-type nitrate/sulfonate/bicarbonate transport system substrate-binding protein
VVGYVPTIDSALLVAAAELGLFEKHGLTVRLSREVGWATIREKLVHEELDAVAAHASMAISIYRGLGVARRACLTGLMLGVNGSAITLSNDLWNLGARDAASLGQVIKAAQGVRPCTFGVPLDLSSQNHNLRKWLRAGGIDPDKDVSLACIPSVVMHESFQAGYLDGYCVAEPWNTMATRSKTGWVAAATCDINPEHPEKILLVLQEFAEKREEEHLRLIAALIEASQFCDIPENRPKLARMLAKSRYFDVREDVLANSLVGPFDFRHSSRPVPGFVMYDSFKFGAPNRLVAKRIFDMVRSLSPAAAAGLHADVMGKVFREDIFQRAARLVRPLPGLVSSNDEPEENPPLPREAGSEPNPFPHRPAIHKSLNAIAA